MSDVQQTRFTIIREDRALDPKTVVVEGLRIGRLADSDVWLNHPHVSRLHAGINQIENDLYLINLSGSNPTTLNGRVVPFNEIEAIVDGDEIQIGPFFLRIEETDGDIRIRVTSQFALNVAHPEPTHLLEIHRKQSQRTESGPLRAPTGELQLGARKQRPPTRELSNAVKVFWGKRTREKAARLSPLHPHTPPRLGKFRFSWTPTRDLIRPWPFAVFIWAFIVVGALAGFAAFTQKNAFAPNALSDSHARLSFTASPPIAKQASGNACTSCHAVGVNVANKDKMNANCTSCHQTNNFEATVIPEHRAAGITCTTCHTEHRGKNFKPLAGALESCDRCHSDQNKNQYNGKKVHTPHGGTFGYPVKNGTWVWKGLDAEELEQKPQVLNFLKRSRVNSTNVDEWRNAQFHGIHLSGIRVVSGVDGAQDENGNLVLSCSSCHKTGYTGTNVDRSSPRTTCGKCHNAEVFNEPLSSNKTAETPSCTSCHVQHVKDSRWAENLRMR